MKKEIIAYCCEHSAYSAADIAGREGLHYPDDILIVRVPCAGRIDVIHILKAFEYGARAVLVIGCENGACHHINGNERAKQRVEYAQTLLKEVGGNEQSIMSFNVAPNAPAKFVQIINTVSAKLKVGV